MVGFDGLIAQFSNAKVEELFKILEIKKDKPQFGYPYYRTPQEEISAFLADFNRMKQVINRMNSVENEMVQYIFEQGGQIKREELNIKFANASQLIKNLEKNFILFENISLKQKVGLDLLVVPKEYSQFFELTEEEKSSLGYLLEAQSLDYYPHFIALYSLEKKIRSKVYIWYQVKEKLLNHDFFRETINHLPPDEKKIFQLALDSDGILEVNELEKLGYKYISVSRYADRRVFNPIQNLYLKALLFPNPPYSPMFLIVPKEFIGFHYQQKGETALTFGSESPQKIKSYGLRILDDLIFFTAFVESGRLKFTQNDLPERKSLNSFLDVIKVQENRYGLFLSFLADLFYTRIASFHLTKKKNNDKGIPALIFKNRTELLKQIIFHWVKNDEWSESFVHRTRSRFSGGRDWDPSIRGKREIVFKALKTLPQDRWIKVEEFYKKVCSMGWRHTELWKTRTDRYYHYYNNNSKREIFWLTSRQIFETLLSESLVWLGIVDLGTKDSQKDVFEISHLKLTSWGSFVLENKIGHFSELPEIEEQNQFTLLPNMEIHVPKGLSFSLLAQILKFAAPTTSYSFSINKDSLRQALDEEMLSKKILEFLKKYSKTGLPANVQRFIEEIYEKQGHIRLGFAGTYLEVSDPLLMMELKSNRQIKMLIKKEAGPHIILLSDPDLTKLANRLKKLGYFPVIETNKRKKDDESSAEKPISALHRLENNHTELFDG